MDVRKRLESQYLAALAMLKEVVVKCPPDAWNAARHKDKTWFKAYHAVYFAHKYLQQSIRDFVPWRGHTQQNRGVVMSREELLEYIRFVQAQVPQRMRETDLRASTGFSAYPKGDRLEMHLINIRHIQQHAGELYERLDAQGGVRLRWTGQIHRSLK